MSETSDIGVVGAGIVGLATAFELRERGASVVVYDSGPPGNGQSAGESRIFRHAHDDERLVRIAKESRRLWSEWEDRFSAELVSKGGALAIGDAVEERLPILERVGGIDARRVDASEIRKLLPPLASFGGHAMFDADGGSIRTRCAVTYLAAALAGAIQVTSVFGLRQTTGGKVEVMAGNVSYEHERVVVCAGKGTGALASGAGVSLPLDLSAHVRFTFPVRDPDACELACLQDSSDEWGETGIYGAPYPGNEHYALGLPETTDAREDGSLVAPDELDELAERANAYVARALPGLVPEPVDVVRCWVTEAPWGEDGLAAWEADDVLFCGGHNLFKQAPWLGRELADWALGEPLNEHLEPRSELGKEP